MDLYKVLGVTREATGEELKKAYRHIALQSHPDRHAQASKQQQEAAACRFREASEAYKILIDPLKRAIYNRGERPQHGHGFSNPSYGPGYANPNYGGSRNHWHRQHYHASSRHGRPLWSLRLSLSPIDVAFHTVLAGTLIIGFFYGGLIGKAIWEGRNAGKSFEDVLEAKQQREKESKGD
eukprot:c22739_g1_i2 orf=85-624(+)